MRKGSHVILWRVLNLGNHSGLTLDKSSDTAFRSIAPKQLPATARNIIYYKAIPGIYGHRLKNNRHPVRSAKDKLQIDQLVVGWVTTSEYWLLYVQLLFLARF